MIPHRRKADQNHRKGGVRDKGRETGGEGNGRRKPPIAMGGVGCYGLTICYRSIINGSIGRSRACRTAQYESAM